MRPTRLLTVCAALAWSLIALACVGNKDIPKIWAELAAVENELAAGAPESLFVVTEPAKDEPLTTRPSAPEVQSPPATPTSPAFSGSVPTGKVHVNGYYRKDGTYVHSHNRSSPRR